MSEDLKTLRERAIADPDVPETVRRFLAGGAELESIVLDARGNWWHQGERFANERLSRLFHRSLIRTVAGTWLLTIPPYTYPVEVEDAGRFAVWGAVTPEGLAARLADGSEELLPWEALCTDGVSFVGWFGADGMVGRIVGDAWHTVEALVDSDAEGRWGVAVGERWVRMRTRPSPADPPQS